MHSIQSQYLDILIPGFTSLAPSIKNQFENEELWQELIRQIGIIEEESKRTSWFVFSSINQDQVTQRLNVLKTDFDATFQNIYNAIQIERYPFLKFLKENNTNFLNLAPTELAYRLTQLKMDFFQYRFKNIPFLRENEACLALWNECFEIPIESIDSIETLHECTTILEVNILEHWIFTQINAVIEECLSNSHELFLKIKKLSHNISQNPQQEEILAPLIQDIQHRVSHKLQDFIIPTSEQSSMSIRQMFTDILGTLSDNLPNEVAEIADVHAIIQASGFSTQNEYSHLAILDFVNYIKYTEEIKNIKYISYAFLRPLLPLYWELVYISKQPKTIMNIIRLIMPLVLLTGYLIAIDTLFKTIPALIALLSIVHAPEIAIILTMVIGIYVGLVAMSYGYENIKVAHQYLTNMYYGGQYKTPVYQINKRMQDIFGEELAKDIHIFYIENMQKLDMDIQELEHKEIHSGLDQKGLDILQNNQNTRKKMELEWMGIHHLTKLATDKVKTHVKARLQEKIKEKAEIFKTTKSADLDELSVTIHESVKGNTTSISLFQPKCLKIKSEIENLVALRNSIH